MSKYDITTDQYGNYVVYDRDGYKVLLNAKRLPTYITLWYNSTNGWEQVGSLTADINDFKFYFDVKFEKYYKVLNLEIEPSHRGLGFGSLLFDVLIEMRGEGMKGVYCFPKKQDRKKIRKLYNKYPKHGRVFYGGYLIFLF